MYSFAWNCHSAGYSHEVTFRCVSTPATTKIQRSDDGSNNDSINFATQHVMRHLINPLQHSLIRVFPSEIFDLSCSFDSPTTFYRPILFSHDNRIISFKNVRIFEIHNRNSVLVNQNIPQRRVLVIYAERVNFRVSFGQPIYKEVVDVRVPLCSNSAIRHINHVASIPHEDAAGMANYDWNRSTLQFGEMFVHFEFSFVISRFGCFLVGLDDNLVPLVGSDRVASSVSSFTEDCDYAIVTVALEVFENCVNRCAR